MHGEKSRTEKEYNLYKREPLRIYNDPYLQGIRLGIVWDKNRNEREFGRKQQSYAQE